MCLNKYKSIACLLTVYQEIKETKLRKMLIMQFW